MQKAKSPRWCCTLRIDRSIKTEHQLKALRSLSDELSENFQLHQNRILQVLLEKLSEAITKLDALVVKENDKPSIWRFASKAGKVKRVKLAACGKESLQKTIQDIDRWSASFDTSWYLIIRLSGLGVDEKMKRGARENEIVQKVVNTRMAINGVDPAPKRAVFLPQDWLACLESKEIRYSPAKLAFAGATEDTYIVDTAAVDLQMPLKDVRDLAKVLMSIDPHDFGLLSCHGVVKNHERDVDGFQFVFNIPLGLKTPRSLRDLLLTADTPPPLDDRFKISTNIAKSAMSIHTCSFIHKNIRPETIVVFEQADSSMMGKAFIIGFESFRLEAGNTYNRGDDIWQKNLYRHPRRQGTKPIESYQMQHDIYSLGVCLLEIGLWASFIDISESTSGDEVASPSLFLGISEQMLMKDRMKRAFSIKNQLVGLATERLPAVTGRKFAGVVIECLTCLDPENDMFGDESEFLDEDGIAVGVRYIEKVLASLEDITI